MQIDVLMLAFHDGETRTVTVPDDTQHVLEATYSEGQEPHPTRSAVSVGDVICYQGFHVVKPIGFAELTPEQLEDYKRIPRRDRAFSHYVERD